MLVVCAVCTEKDQQTSPRTIKVIREPYLQSTIADSVSIIWRTDLGSKCSVRYKKMDEQEWHQHSGMVDQINDRVYENIVTIKDLKKGQRYLYEIFTDGQHLRSEKKYYFNSTVAPTDLAFSFFAVGDIGEAVENGGKPDLLSQAISQRNGDYSLGLLLGDIVYPRGESKGYDVHLFPYFADIFSTTTMWPVPGNHDWGSDFETNYAAQWKLPGNEHYYSFNHGNIHFIGLDSKNGEFYDSDNQFCWLQQDLKDAHGNYDWILVFLHHNGKSCTYKDDYQAVIDLYPLFEEYQVDLVLNGHAHTYERLKPMDGTGAPIRLVEQKNGQQVYRNIDGFISITVGSGGKLRGVGTDPTPYEPDPDSCIYPDLVAAYHHTWAFMELQVNGTELNGNAIDVQNGKILDSFLIIKSE